MSMVAYERYVTIVKQDEVVISGLPLREGQRVRVTVVVEEGDQKSRGAEMRALFAQTQVLPQAKAVNEADIAAQVAAARASAA